MCHCDAEPVELHEQRNVKGRKPHKCSECGIAIPIGEEHRVDSYMFDGHFYRERTCLACVEAGAEAHRVAHKHDACFCPSFGGLSEAIREDIDEAWWTPVIQQFFARRAGVRQLRLQLEAA